MAQSETGLQVLVLGSIYQGKPLGVPIFKPGMGPQVFLYTLFHLPGLVPFWGDHIFDPRPGQIRRLTMKRICMFVSHV